MSRFELAYNDILKEVTATFRGLVAARNDTHFLFKLRILHTLSASESPATLSLAFLKTVVKLIIPFLLLVFLCVGP